MRTVAESPSSVSPPGYLSLGWHLAEQRLVLEGTAIFVVGFRVVDIAYTKLRGKLHVLSRARIVIVGLEVEVGFGLVKPVNYALGQLG